MGAPSEHWAEDTFDGRGRLLSLRLLGGDTCRGRFYDACRLRFFGSNPGDILFRDAAGLRRLRLTRRLHHRPSRIFSRPRCQPAQLEHAAREMPEKASHVEPMNHVERNKLTERSRGHAASKDVDVVTDAAAAFLRFDEKPSRPLVGAAKETKANGGRLVQFLETKTKGTADQRSHFEFGSKESGFLVQDMHRPPLRPPLGIGGGRDQHAPNLLGRKGNRDLLACAYARYDTHDEMPPSIKRE